jgi:hypothetical protein
MHIQGSPAWWVSVLQFVATGRIGCNFLPFFSKKSKTSSSQRFFPTLCGKSRRELAPRLGHAGRERWLLGAFSFGRAAFAVVSMQTESPRDPLAFGLAFVIMTIVVLAACFFPAWRATRIDPVRALRG